MISHLFLPTLNVQPRAPNRRIARVRLAIGAMPLVIPVLIAPSTVETALSPGRMQIGIGV